MTEHLARVSARRPWMTVGIWVVMIAVAAALIFQFLGSATTTDFRLAGRYESERANTFLTDRLRGPEKSAEIVIVQSETLTADDDAFRAKVEAVHASIVSLGPEVIAGGLDGNQGLHHYYQAQQAVQGAQALQSLGIAPPFSAEELQQIQAAAAAAGQAEFAQQLLADPKQAEQLLAVAADPEKMQRLLGLLLSPDKRTALIHYTMAGTSQEATGNVAEVIEKVEEANEADDFLVLIGGDASVAHENNELARHDLERGERFGVPVALIVLLVLFGAVVATMLPLGLAIVSILIALAAVAIIGQYSQLVFFVTMMVVMIGLAVGIDYSLLIVSRFKEELGHGLGTKEAVVKTGGTAGRTVFFSGATVVLALIGLLIVPASFYQSLALGAILVVIASLAATLTLLPAVLALLGPKVDFLTVPFISRFSLKSPEASEQGFWESITRIVTRFPVVSILAIAIPMIALAAFYLDIRTGLNDVNTFPDSAETKKAFIILTEEFSVGEVSPAGVLSPAEIVVVGNISDPQVEGAISRLEQAIVDSSDFPVPAEREVNDAGDLALLTLPFPGESTSRAATGYMETLRDELIPAAFEGVPAEVYVGGLTAESTDFYGIVRVYTPIVFAFVLGLSFVILMMVFRSIVIPIKAIIMNLLSVGATYGLLVVVFQKGVGADLLGFDRAVVIDAWLPLFLFTILFGLSMDYHVFLLSRIRERYDETGRTTPRRWHMGCGRPLASSPGAALIMVVVFGAFATGRDDRQSAHGLRAGHSRVFLTLHWSGPCLSQPAWRSWAKETGICRRG